MSQTEHTRWQSKWSKYVRSIVRLSQGAVRRVTRRRCRGYFELVPFLRRRKGLEIGGPSQIFRNNHLIPAYDLCSSIDNCNFSDTTIWDTVEGHRQFGPRLGKQFVAEASNLSSVPEEAYDFVLASHVLEHVANPLKALQEWRRVLTGTGVLVVIVPHRAGTFDRRRPFTSLSHIESDFQQGTAEDDLTHLDEILQLHDLDLDPPAGSPEQFRQRCLRNASIRGMHHHVFSPELLVSVLNKAGMKLLSVAIERPFHIIATAQKTIQPRDQLFEENTSFLGEAAEWRKHDPLSH